MLAIIYIYFNFTIINIIYRSNCTRHVDAIRGGFRHVQHVGPNRAPTKRGPHKRAIMFWNLQKNHLSNNTMKKAVCAVHESMWRSGLRAETRWVANSVLQSPSLHTRIGVLNALKLTYSKPEFLKFSGDKLPDPCYWIRPWTQWTWPPIV